MPRYTVFYMQERHGAISVEADSEDDARELGQERLDMGEPGWDHESPVGVTLVAPEEGDQMVAMGGELVMQLEEDWS